MYENVYTLRNLSGLITNTYILSMVFAVAFIGVAYLVANMIAFEGGKNPTDAKTRKVWFYILGVTATIFFFLWNYFYVADLIKGAKGKSDFLIHNALATTLCFAIYLILGFVVAKVFKHSKFGTIF